MREGSSIQESRKQIAKAIVNMLPEGSVAEGLVRRKEGKRKEIRYPRIQVSVSAQESGENVDIHESSLRSMYQAERYQVSSG